MAFLLGGYMIRNICKDIEFLKTKSIDSNPNDKNVMQDLKDTLGFNLHRCVGMAANMIGVNKRTIIFVDAKSLVIMNNPVILSKSGQYQTNEGCLSLEGQRPTIRYKKIKVQYYDEDFKIKIKTYTEFTAQIIQHEMDHLEGIII